MTNSNKLADVNALLIDALNSIIETANCNHWLGMNEGRRSYAMARDAQIALKRAASMLAEHDAQPALLTNPHTGTPRDYRDVESDPAGTLIVKPGEPLRAAPQPAPAPVQDVACDAAAVERALVYLAFQEDDAQWPDAYSKDEQDMEREKMRGVLAAANSTSGPGAYCRACQSVGMRNCQHFDECSGATCITCHRPFNPPASKAAHPPAPAADNNPAALDGAAELPPLPEAAYRLGGTVDTDGFDADDMYEYARAAIASQEAQITALRQPVPDAVRELPGKWRAEADRIITAAEGGDGVQEADAYGADLVRLCAAELESALASQQESRNDD